MKPSNMTKDEIKTQLDEAGIEYDAQANKATLESLLPKQEEPKKEIKQERIFKVVDNKGKLQGVFSRTRQGKNYEKLAYEFARNKGYAIK